MSARDTTTRRTQKRHLSISTLTKRLFITIPTMPTRRTIRKSTRATSNHWRITQLDLFPSSRRGQGRGLTGERCGCVVSVWIDGGIWASVVSYDTHLVCRGAIGRRCTIVSPTTACMARSGRGKGGRVVVQTRMSTSWSKEWVWVLLIGGLVVGDDLAGGSVQAVWVVVGGLVVESSIRIIVSYFPNAYSLAGAGC